MPDSLVGAKAIEVVLPCSEKGDARGVAIPKRSSRYIEYAKLRWERIRTKIKTRYIVDRLAKIVPRSVIAKSEPHEVVEDHCCSSIHGSVYLFDDPKTGLIWILLTLGY